VCVQLGDGQGTLSSSNQEACEQQGNKGFWYTQGTALDASTAASSATATAVKPEAAEASSAQQQDNAKWFQDAMDKFDERCREEVRCTYDAVICTLDAATRTWHVYAYARTSPGIHCAKQITQYCRSVTLGH